ncbi:MAG TPA: carboxypeptidase-like regulatory domain-containing protein, partial [Blastocatellia bacterium]|nr:carboxypeptidase-like regulatory domain-containing protein [Blastocatellia bacterium]
MRKQSLCLVMTLIFGLHGVMAQQTAGTLSGRISDQQGGVVVAATLTVVDAKGVERTALTNEQGDFSVAGLAPGKLIVRVVVEGFVPYESTTVEIAAGQRGVLNIQLAAAAANSEVTISQDSPTLSTASDKTANTIVLKGEELDSLPDDPDDLANSLQAMAGQSAGPNGGQLYVDGFASGRLPAKISIREVRINQNPIAAENDSPGIGRIDIFTQPGSDKLHGN